MVGQAVTYTATVSAIAATGSITFEDAGTAIAGCAGQAVGFGAATCALSGYTAAGAHSITATYSGDINYLTSTSSALTQTVDLAATTTTVSPASNPSQVGQAVTYTATLNIANATGTVAFQDAGATITGCAAQTVNSGSATCTVASYATAGEHAITATYNGDSDYAGSTSSPLNQVVSKASTSTTLTSSVNPSIVWQPVTYTAKVSSTAATGTVAFEEAGMPIVGCTAQTVSSGIATCTHLGYTATGTHSITASYSGDGNYLTSASSSVKQVVDKMGTTKATATLASSLTPSTVGQPVAYTATISPATATGSVSFDEAGTPITGCIAQPVNSGIATCTVASLGVGGHSITAVYSGDSNYAASTSPGLIQTVYKKASTTSVSSSLDPSMVGQSVTITATVSAAVATGTVEFKQSGVTIVGCSAQTISSGIATCIVASLGVGGHSITAVYSGDSNYAASTSPGLIQTVYKKASTTSVSSSLDPSMVGQSVTITATVSAAVATGTVEFKQSGVTIVGCSAQTISSGIATCIVASLGVGGHSITAVYSGDSNYAASTSPGLIQTVYKKASATVVLSSPDPSTVGEGVTYTATVSPATATGTVAFDEAGTPIVGCAARPVSSGTATCAVASLAAGGHWITAVYFGDSNYATSASPGLTQTVNKKASTTEVSSSADPSTVGQSVTYTATVSSVAATGTIEFQEEGTPITGCTADTISSGAAKCTVAGYPSWSSYTITAAYSGDSSYLASVSSVFTQTVEPPVDLAGPFRFFSPTSFWNEELPAGAPLDPSSAGVVGALNETIADERQVGKGPGINTTVFSVPVYTVPANQPTVMVTLNASIEAMRGASALQSAWDAVPLPADAQPAAGTDKHLVVWQPSTDRLWEFWQLEDTSEGWQAGWGGAMQNASSDPGVYGPEAWPGAGTGWGASASSLSIAGGLITLEDLEKGQINHALAMAIPDPRAGVYASPAERTDGKSTSPLSLPEGAHLRLDPNLNLASLHLSRVMLMIAEAAQRYGIVVRDTASHVTLYAQDPRRPARTRTWVRTATSKGSPLSSSSNPSPGATYNYWNYTTNRERQAVERPVG
jgi:hypothetical protein